MAAKATTTKAAGKAKSAPASAATAPAAVKTGAAGKAAAPVTVSLKQIAGSLSEQHGLARKETETLLTNFVETLTGHLKAGERVRIGGLGVIEVKHRAARMGRNPATGESIQIAASKKLAFRAAKDLKEAI